MCGLWISVGFEPSSQAIETVNHRGPDGTGEARFQTARGPLTMLHKRLAVFDLDPRAAQPMSNRKRTHTLVFNGAIYNHVELRHELEGLDHKFTTSSDTEVLLAAFVEWGIACLPRLNGMFAFAIHDHERQQLFVARDRFGIKPLYLWSGANSLAFASEIKQLLTIPSLAPRIHHAALQDFLVHGLTDHGAATCFADILPVPPGHFLQLDLNGPLPGSARKAEFTRWYELPEPDHAPLSAGETAEEFLHLLTSSVGLRLRGDVPVGSCLSGGLDSSAIVGAVAARGNREQHVVSAVYPGAPVDESIYIDAVTARYPHLTVHKVKPDAEAAIEALERMIWHQDEPVASTSPIAQWCVMAKARREGLTVMLDGQGADEIYGGYHPFFGVYLANLARRGHGLDFVKTVFALRSTHGYSLVRQINWLAMALMSPALVERARAKLGRNSMADWLNNGDLDFQVALRNPGDFGISRSAAGTAHRRAVAATSLPMLLRFEDRNAMAHGIEARVPFLDHRLVESALKTGGRYDIQNGETKWPIRHGAASLVPEEVRNRRDKLGFATPERDWMLGALAPHVTGWVEDAIEALPQLFNKDRLRRQSRAMLEGSRAYDNALWRVCSLGIWARRFGVVT